LRIVTVTPLGEGGKGGIDRMTDAIREEVRRHSRVDAEFRFVTSRGDNIYWSPLVLAAAIVTIAYLRLMRRIDVLHVNLSANASTYRKLVVCLVAAALRIPYVIHLHSGEFGSFWTSRKPFMQRRIDLMFRRAKAVLVLGRVWSELVMNRLPEIASQVAILPNATRAGRKGICVNRSTNILFLGRLCRAKGIPELLDAFAALRPVEGWHATLAGDGEVLETRMAIDHLGLAHRVRVPGWVGSDAVAALLQEADILVLPSLIENLPMCVVEAFAHGIAVVCTHVGALPDIVEHERTGLLVSPEDALALTAALRRLLIDPDLRARLGAQARAEHAARLEIGAYVDKLISILQRASS
jgi:glycosyltransferase involved in cell wall biosynthesis